MSLGWTNLTGGLQGAVFLSATGGLTSVWIGIVASELFQRLALGADVLVILFVPFEVGSGEGAIGALRLIDHRDERNDAAPFDQPAEVLGIIPAGAGEPK